jgi:adenylate cyclase
MNKWLVGVLITGTLIMPLLFSWSALEIIKLKTFDALVPEKEPSGYFSILNITEEDIAREGGYPLPRQRLAEIQIDLLNNGAIGVGWVMAFPQPDRFGGDPVFAETLAYAPTVLAMFENDSGDYPPTTGTVIMGEDRGGIDAEGVIQNIDMLKQNANQGIAVARTEVDSLVRRLPLLLRTPDGWVPAYGTEVLKILAGADTYLIKTNDNGLEEIRVRGLNPVPVDSLGRKWISWVDTPQTDLQEMQVKDKFVFVGFTAKGIMPQLSVPNGQLLEPHKIQAALAESILIEDSPYVPDWGLAAEVLAFGVTVLLAWLLINIFGITLGISFSGLLFLLTAGSEYYLIQQGLLIDVTWTLISQFITASTAFYLRFREQYKLRQQIKAQFGKYLDPRMVKKLQDNPELCQVNGKRVDCSIIFTDLRGFTSLSESVEPEMVTYIMNNVLDAQVKAANKYFGCTDKFIGDAGMFHWNTIIPQPDHHTLALKAAQEIEKNIKELNIRFKEEGIPEIAIGIGVNSGVCIAGNFGATDRFAFSLIGDPCNVAARLESGTKEAGVGVLIGEETAKNVAFKLQLLKPLKVKGKKKALSVYTWAVSYL